MKEDQQMNSIMLCKSWIKYWLGWTRDNRNKKSNSAFIWVPNAAFKFDNQWHIGKKHEKLSVKNYVEQLYQAYWNLYLTKNLFEWHQLLTELFCQSSSKSENKSCEFIWIAQVDDKQKPIAAAAHWNFKAETSNCLFTVTVHHSVRSHGSFWDLLEK